MMEEMKANGMSNRTTQIILFVLLIALVGVMLSVVSPAVQGDSRARFGYISVYWLAACWKAIGPVQRECGTTNLR